MEPSLSDPYGYLDKGDFTSELYKIEIKNLHTKVGFSQLKQRLKSIGLNPHKVKILKDLSFVTFKSAEDRDMAIEKVTGHNWKGKTLLAKIAKGRADPYLQKRKELQDENADSSDSKRLKLDDQDVRTDEEKLKDHVVKYWRKPYENQLIAKENKIKGILQNLYLKLNKENPMIKASTNYFSQTDDHDVICPLWPIIRSPIESDYRNKCEFTIGMTLDGKGPIAGFCHGKYRGGFDAVGDASSLSILPDKMVAIIDHLNLIWPILMSEKFQPQLTLFTPGIDEGHLRGVTLRMGSINLDQSTNGDTNSSLLMIIDLHPQNLTEIDLESISTFFHHYFMSPVGEGIGCGITSLLLTTRRNNSDPVDLTTTRIIAGSGFVYERLMDINFRISFNAFFQVNTLAAQELYGAIRRILVKEVIEKCPGKKITLLDVCCGTGTIGLAMADIVHNVIGVEMCAESITDAIYNAKLNKIDNASFHVGKAEDLMANLLNMENRNEVDHEFVVIVDPPRAGLHTNVVQALRRCSLVNKIIYVSCSPESAYKNFIEFARPVSKRTHGRPFIPEMSVPVDLFPQTPHVELIMLLTRLVLPNN